jgi:hypothetical protein
MSFTPTVHRSLVNEAIGNVVEMATQELADLVERRQALPAQRPNRV